MTPQKLRAIGRAYTSGGSVPEAMVDLRAHEEEVAALQRLAAPTSSYRVGRLVRQAERYLALRVDMRAELDVPMRMSERRELLRAFESDEPA